MSTKIHALVDALGNPPAFILSSGQAHDLIGADQLLPGMEADLLIADKAFDADERVITMMADKNKAVVIPPKANRKIARTYDRDLYKARHLIENFFAKIKQFRAIATFLKFHVLSRVQVAVRCPLPAWRANLRETLWLRR